MPLPKVEHPTFEVEVPSTKQKVLYRPFTVKEHRMLMKAVEFRDDTNLAETFRNVVDACTFGKLELDKLAMFDMDFLFLTIRSASTGGTVKVVYRCNAKKEDGTSCGSKINVMLDTTQAKIDVPPDSVRNIEITKNIGLRMRYPTFNDYVKKYHLSDDLQKFSEELLLDCIEMVYDEHEMNYADKDFTREELTAFMDDLDESTHERIVEFVSNIPELHMDIKMKCPACGAQSDVHLQGLQDFLE